MTSEGEPLPAWPSALIESVRLGGSESPLGPDGPRAPAGLGRPGSVAGPRDSMVPPGPTVTAFHCAL
eukprot:665373-Hanusia_phi.AAC.2